jgi:methylenetetrahydrofolate dehydrogenase (NADP+)/methenyltetrahydrofolate cyclohydrolase
VCPFKINFGSIVSTNETIGARYPVCMSSADTSPVILDGIAIASQIKSELADKMASARHHGYTPGLAVILVGEVPASQIYVRSKVKTCAELGIYSEMHTPEASATTEELLALVDSLNAREEIDGILIQLPLPSHVDTALLLEAVDPAKDVDGFHPINAGRLLNGFPMEQVLAPCTPAGIMEVLRRSRIPIAGQRAVVLGRSNIVGKPIAAMLLNASATVTICHSKTANLAAITKEANILVAAIGRPGFVTPDMVQRGATIIDVGINRLTTETELQRFFPHNVERRRNFAKRGSTIVGDVDPAAFAVAGAYTPVPGGVGALTIAMLMANTIKAARMRRG